MDEAAFAGEAGAGAVRVGVEQGTEVPATVRGGGPDGVGAVGDEAPQVFGGAYAAGVAAAHGDDGDGFPLVLARLVQPLPGLVEFGGDPLEIAEEPVLVGLAGPVRALVAGTVGPVFRPAVTDSHQDPPNSLSMKAKTSSTVAV